MRGTLTLTLSQSQIASIEQHLLLHKWPVPMDPPRPKFPGDDATTDGNMLLGQVKPRYVRRGVPRSHKTHPGCCRGRFRNRKIKHVKSANQRTTKTSQLLGFV